MASQELLKTRKSKQACHCIAVLKVTFKANHEESGVPRNYQLACE